MRRISGFATTPVMALLCTVAVHFSLTTANPGKADVVIYGATVIDGSGAAPVRASLVLRGDTIEDVLQSGSPVPPARVSIDGRGKYVIPGPWDVHVHLAVRPEPALAEGIMFPLFLAHGLPREGTIARGKRADLVVLTADPLSDIRNVSHVDTVVLGGRVLTRADLDRLLAGARDAAAR